MGALGIGPYGRAGDPGHTSTLPALPPGKPDATLPAEKPFNPTAGAASGAKPYRLNRYGGRLTSYSVASP